MSKKQTVLLVIGTAIVTFFLSALVSKMVFMSPKGLASTIKQNPLVVMEALQAAAKLAGEQQKQKQAEAAMKDVKDIKTAGRVTFGPKNAKVTIVEYSDFQCPYCARASKGMEGLIKKYNGKVNLVYKHFPLSFHPFAKPAAEYFEAIAINDHGKAKKFHDYIFDNFDQFARVKTKAEINKALNKILKSIGVSPATVKANLSKAKAVVEADLQEGKTIGVTGTPNFFVNGISAQHVGPEALIKKFL